MTSTFSFASRDGLVIHCYSWVPESPHAVLQIVHGSLEHAQRYNAFAEFLSANGIAVYAQDMRGHGATAASPEDLCYFSDERDGRELALHDIHVLVETMRSSHPGLPLFVLGHSMGAFLVQAYICRHGGEIDGAIVSGTAGGRWLALFFGEVVSRMAMVVHGRKRRSTLIHNLCYGPLIRSVRERTSDQDFLSRDPDMVKAYVDDPLCGVTVTPEYAVHLLHSMRFVATRRVTVGVPHTLPIYMFSGEKCPVGGTKGDASHARRVFTRYKAAGVIDITLKIYPGARHETLNETNRQEVFSDVLTWLNRHLVSNS